MDGPQDKAASEITSQIQPKIQGLLDMVEERERTIDGLKGRGKELESALGSKTERTIQLEARNNALQDQVLRPRA